MLSLYCFLHPVLINFTSASTQQSLDDVKTEWAKRLWATQYFHSLHQCKEQNEMDPESHTYCNTPFPSIAKFLLRKKLQRGNHFIEIDLCLAGLILTCFWDLSLLSQNLHYLLRFSCFFHCLPGTASPYSLATHKRMNVAVLKTFLSTISVRKGGNIYSEFCNDA